MSQNLFTVTVGKGKAVHLYYQGTGRTACGADGMGTKTVVLSGSLVVTCKNCLKDENVTELAGSPDVHGDRAAEEGVTRLEAKTRNLDEQYAETDDESIVIPNRVERRAMARDLKVQSRADMRKRHGRGKARRRLNTVAGSLRLGDRLRVGGGPVAEVVREPSHCVLPGRIGQVAVGIRYLGDPQDVSDIVTLDTRYKIRLVA